MRLEINIGDEAPEAQILGAVDDPTAYLMALVRLDRGNHVPRSVSVLPDYAHIFADAQNCPSAFKTKEDIDKHIDQLRNEW